MDQPLAAAFEETLEEACGLGDGAARRKRSAEQRRSIVRRKCLGFVEQARRRAREQGRDLGILDERMQRLAPSRSLLAADIGERHRVVGVQR